jgi:hypothetical protein
MAAGKIDAYLKKLEALDVKDTVSKAVEADKRKPSAKGKKLLEECNKLYVEILKKSKQFDEVLDAEYDQCTDLIKKMTDESLAQAQSKISTMRKLATAAAAAFQGLEKVLAAIKKEYALH